MQNEVLNQQFGRNRVNEEGGRIMMWLIIVMIAGIWLLTRLVGNVLKSLLYTAGQMQKLYEDENLTIL